MQHIVQGVELSQMALRPFLFRVMSICTEEKLQGIACHLIAQPKMLHTRWLIINIPVLQWMERHMVSAHTAVLLRNMPRLFELSYFVECPVELSIYLALGFFQASTLVRLRSMVLNPYDKLGWVAIGSLRQLQYLEIKDWSHGHTDIVQFMDVRWSLHNLVYLGWNSSHYEVLLASDFPKLQHFRLDIQECILRHELLDIRAWLLRIPVMQTSFFARSGSRYDNTFFDKLMFLVPFVRAQQIGFNFIPEKLQFSTLHRKVATVRLELFQDRHSTVHGILGLFQARELQNFSQTVADRQLVVMVVGQKFASAFGSYLAQGGQRDSFVADAEAHGVRLVVDDSVSTKLPKPRRM
jgi:hypothetical protein